MATQGLTPVEWKRYYEAERARLGRDALRAMVERAPAVALDQHAAIFPHTRLEVTGDMVVAVARAVVDSGAGEVLAIGVLHGQPSTERRVHLPGEVSTRDEFSLDAFVALLTVAADLLGKPAPTVHMRYPLLVGTDPSSLPGIDELARLAERMPMVATADPIHHGIGYGDDGEHALDGSSPAATSFARESIDRQLGTLAAHDFAAFQEECGRVRSDFRNAGPTLACLVGKGAFFETHRVDLVDYTTALGANGPTWVAGALVTLRRFVH